MTVQGKPVPKLPLAKCMGTQDDDHVNGDHEHVVQRACPVPGSPGAASSSSSSTIGEPPEIFLSARSTEEQRMQNTFGRQASWPYQRGTMTFPLRYEEIKDVHRLSSIESSYRTALTEMQNKVASQEAQIDSLSEEVGRRDLAENANERSLTYYVRLLKQNWKIGEELDQVELENGELRARIAELETHIQRMHMEHTHQMQAMALHLNHELADQQAQHMQRMHQMRELVLQQEATADDHESW